MKFQRTINADRERRIWERLQNGELGKTVAWDEGVSFSTITRIKEALPLFCGLPFLTGRPKKVIEHD